MQLVDKLGKIIISRRIEMQINEHESVVGTWNFDYEDCTLQEVLDQSTSSKVIAEMNKLRKRVQAKDADALKIVREHTFKVAEHVRRARVVERALSVEEMKAKILAMNDAEQASYIKMLLDLQKLGSNKK